MKKTYIIPSMEEVKTSGLCLLSGSGVSGDNGIGFGGIDDGGHDPGMPSLDIESEDLLGLPL